MNRSPKIIIDDNISDTESLIDLIHDMFFDIDDIWFDSKVSVLKFKLGNLAKKSFFLKEIDYSYQVIVKGVNGYILKDTEKVGYYDINTLEFDGNYLVFKCSIPLEFKLELTQNSQVNLENL